MICLKIRKFSDTYPASEKFRNYSTELETLLSETFLWAPFIILF